MSEKRRLDIRGILSDPNLRRELMVPTLQATQAREGIDTTREQAQRAYYVVTEGERATFFDVVRFRGKKGQRDRRHEIFVQALKNDVERVRFDVARRDFATIEGSPLAYQRLSILAPVFRRWPSSKSTFGVVQRGAPTAEDERLVRYHWEVGFLPPKERRSWEPFSKGGSFSRFYFDVLLRVAWDPVRRTFFEWHGRKGRPIERPESLDNFFLPSIAWPRRTQRGFNVRYVTGAIFSDKSGFIQTKREADLWFALGVLNSELVEFLLSSLVSFGSYEVGAVQRIPVAPASDERYKRITSVSKAIWEAKASWDEGNETSTRFEAPWILREDLVDSGTLISERLNRLVAVEAAEQARIQNLYSELNDEVYSVYEEPEKTRAVIREALSQRAPEVLWPHMEGKSVEQKRTEHVFRLLSYVVKRVVHADEDGIIAFDSIVGESSLLDRVSRELQALFRQFEVGEVEIEVANELKMSAKGYRRTSSIAEWLNNAFFEYHSILYDSRPIIWHIASAQGATPNAFGALIDYRRFDRNRMAKLRGQYVRDAIDHFRREAALADKAGRTDQRIEWQARLEEAQELDRRLQWVQEGRHEGRDGGDHDFRILTPWKSPDRRPRDWDPDLDDGVKVNIEPLQKAGVLRIAKVV